MKQRHTPCHVCAVLVRTRCFTPLPCLGYTINPVVAAIPYYWRLRNIPFAPQLLYTPYVGIIILLLHSTALCYKAPIMFWHVGTLIDMDPPISYYVCSGGRPAPAAGPEGPPEASSGPAAHGPGRRRCDQCHLAHWSASYLCRPCVLGGGRHQHATTGRCYQAGRATQYIARGQYSSRCWQYTSRTKHYTHSLACTCTCGANYDCYYFRGCSLPATLSHSNLWAMKTTDGPGSGCTSNKVCVLGVTCHQCQRHRRRYSNKRTLQQPKEQGKQNPGAQELGTKAPEVQVLLSGLVMVA
jgi:hypothetical protein